MSNETSKISQLLIDLENKKKTTEISVNENLLRIFTGLKEDIEGELGASVEVHLLHNKPKPQLIVDADGSWFEFTINKGGQLVIKQSRGAYDFKTIKEDVENAMWEFKQTIE